MLAALAETAGLHNYTKPVLHGGDELIAADVRPPIVERHVSEAFVPNDVSLDGGARQLVILTGPNMGGKSTYLRQTALMSLMAQAGSFVAARRRVRQHRARPVDVHGGDAGDGQHPAFGEPRAKRGAVSG